MSNPSGINMRGAVDLAAYAKAAEAKRNPQAQATASPQDSRDGLFITVTEQNLGELVERSTQIPIIVDISSSRSPASIENSKVLRSLVTGYGGRLVLATVDADASPQVASAFQVQSLPTTIALLGGQPAPLFQGAPPQEDVEKVLAQVLDVAAQNGIVGTVPAQAEDEPEQEPEVQAPERELTPTQASAYMAMEQGRYAEAVAAFERALVENPIDTESQTALANAKVWQRATDGEPTDGDQAGQLADADTLFVQGQPEQAMDTLLSAFMRADTEQRELIRERLIGYFEVVGQADPAVTKARARLAGMLY